MFWYWIVLIVIGYFIIHLVTAIIIYKTGFATNKVDAAMPGILWPLTLPTIIIWWILNKFVI